MNRDGYRAGRATAEHEAAHAVIAVLSGLAVGSATIAPPKADRERFEGRVYADLKILDYQRGMITLAPITATAHLDVDVAGFAWESRYHAQTSTDDALRGADATCGTTCTAPLTG